MNDFKGKSVTIVGLARSGVGAANLLSEFGAIVTITDIKKPEELGAYIKELKSDIRCELGGHPKDIFEKTDLIVISPGVPADIEPLKKAHSKGIKIIGELELAYSIVTNNSKSPNGYPRFLAITGTNGKSTTTSLLYEIINAQGFRTIIGGNIGNALTEEIYKNLTSIIDKTDYFVVEVSSFQLESIIDFKPFSSAILNITPDHLDRYASMSEYIDAKCKIFSNQKESDFVILNADDESTDEILLRLKSQTKGSKSVPQVFYFSRKKKVEGAYYDNSKKMIFFNLPKQRLDSLNCKFNITADFYLEPESFKIKGVHNIENVMAASLMALLSGCSPLTISEALKGFPGLKHRLEFVRELNGVIYINDSKGTNVGAVIKSLESFDKPVILIAGGRDKHGDFTLLGKLIKDKVKTLILMGEAKDKINKAIGHLTHTIIVNDLLDAIKTAQKRASSGDVVLLSPACASFDMFRDFEDRGEQFKKMVMEL